MSTRLTQRELVGELMDAPDLDEAVHRQALRGLARLNLVGRSGPMILDAVRHHFHNHRAHHPLRLLDVACGAGDVTLRLARGLSRTGLDVAVDGCDLSDTALAAARARAASRSDASPARFFRQDVIDAGVPAGYDIYVLNLFLHHLDNDAARTLLARIVAHRPRLVVVGELARSWPALIGTCLATRALTRSRIVHVDGLRSVRAGFTAAELAELARDAGMARPRVTHHRPARLRLVWSAE
ncbi:MAG: methyltransferase domain-containing protein [Phycisphaeraceae bacterium]